MALARGSTAGQRPRGVGQELHAPLAHALGQLCAPSQSSVGLPSGSLDTGHQSTSEELRYKGGWAASLQLSLALSCSVVYHDDTVYDKGVYDKGEQHRTRNLARHPSLQLGSCDCFRTLEFAAHSG